MHKPSSDDLVFSSYEREKKQENRCVDVPRDGSIFVYISVIFFWCKRSRERRISRRYCFSRSAAKEICRRRRRRRFPRLRRRCFVRTEREIIFSFLSSFPSIQVVAPIRETGAQTLSIICNYFHDQPQCSALLSILLHLLEHDGTWEVRHGALLTLKYTFNILKVNLQPWKTRSVRDEILGDTCWNAYSMCASSSTVSERWLGRCCGISGSCSTPVGHSVWSRKPGPFVARLAISTRFPGRSWLCTWFDWWTDFLAGRDGWPEHSR